MKRNKTFYHIIASVCLMMGMSSCSDFLQVEPQNEIILEKFWNEKADVDGIIFGCYSAMQSDNILMRMMVWGEFRRKILPPLMLIRLGISFTTLSTVAIH